MGKSTLLSVLCEAKINALCGEKMHLVAQFEDEDDAKSSCGQRAAIRACKRFQVESREKIVGILWWRCAGYKEEVLEENAVEEVLLRKLGFKKRVLREETPIALLSGGWRMRARLAVALNAGAEVLLLDEQLGY